MAGIMDVGWATTVCQKDRSAPLFATIQLLLYVWMQKLDVIMGCQMKDAGREITVCQKDLCALLYVWIQM